MANNLECQLALGSMIDYNRSNDNTISNSRSIQYKMTLTNQRLVFSYQTQQLFVMEANLQLLPPRRKPQGKIQPAGKAVKLSTNLYEVSLKRSPNLEQYTLDAQPYIDDHAVSLLRKILSTKNEELRKEIGLLTFKGKTLWGTKMLTKPLIMKVGKVQQKIDQDYEIILKHTRSIAQSEIFALKGNQFRRVQQVYTVALREKLFSMGLRQTTRHRFIQKGEGQKVKGYTILKCYELKLVPIMKKLNLLVDIGFRLLNQRNALEELQDFKNNFGKEEYVKGKVVVTMYNNRSYKIDKICFDMNPKSTFFHEKRGKNITFLQYFKEYHKIVPLQPNQALFETTICTREQIKGETKVKIYIKGYLIPQFCKFAATMSSIRDQDFHSFSDISKKIRIFPDQRKSDQVNLIKEINNNKGDLDISELCTEAQSYVYQDIRVQGKTQKFCYNGMLKDLKQIKEPRRFSRNELLFVYSKDKNDRSQVQKIFDDLSYSAQYYNIQLNDAQFIGVENNGVENWVQRISKFMSSNPKMRESLRLIILLFANNEKSYYSQLKKYITSQLALPCQVILKKTAENKNKTTILGKIALQINAKTGNTLWSVQTKHPFWSKKKVAIGAISISKNLKHQKKGKLQPYMQAQNKKNFVIGFVGTCSQDFSKIYANTVLVEKEQQLSSVQPFQQIVADWLKNYKSKQDNLPQIIVIYRQGLTQKQVNTRANAQVDGIQKVIQRAKVRYPNYNPQLIYILVTKKSSKRLYRPQRCQGSGKFAPTIMNNPIPGTIVFESISSQDIYDFHLTAQATTQGTAMLTNYRIAYDASQIPQEAIAQFTMQQCYNYPNWQGGISVPGCLQSADRLSKLVGQHIHQNITDKSVNFEQSVQAIRNKPFYL